VQKPKSRSAKSSGALQPLNIRATPNGAIIGRAANGVLVSIVETASDNRGRAWALIRPATGGGAVGWVFREFVSCF
jgi:hypothetical protein